MQALVVVVHVTVMMNRKKDNDVNKEVVHRQPPLRLGVRSWKI